MLKIKRNYSLILGASILLLAAFNGQSNPSGLFGGLLSSIKPAISQADVPSSELLAAYQSTLEQIYQQVSPSVVNIEVAESAATVQRMSPGSPYDGATALGSGFVWDTAGHIVTNNHVIDGATKITVTFVDGTIAAGQVVGADPNSDLAVVQVSLPQSELKPIQLISSSGVKVGQMAIAIGNPFGLSGTMTAGIISGLNRSLPVDLNSPSYQSRSRLLTGSMVSIPDIVQTDAPINPGNSGGVLVDDQGQLIGVTSAIASPVDANSGVGFVIPSSIVQKIVPALIQTGHYSHPWLGISGVSITPDLAKANNLDAAKQGVLVVNVSSNGPGALAGILGSNRRAWISGEQLPVGGDIIIAIDQHSIKNFDDMSSYLFDNTQSGQSVTVTVLRNGQTKELTLTLGTAPLPTGS